jgi:putative DNA primase/helicase
MLASEPVARVLEMLGDSLQKSNWGWLAKCPSHEDHTASLSIREGREGRLLLYCFAGCSTEEVVRGLGLQMTDLFPEGLGYDPSRPYFPPVRREVPKAKPKERPPLTLVASYGYADEIGVYQYEVMRYEPKTFKQRHLDKNGNWVWGLEGVRRLIYRLPEVLAAIERGDMVFVVEGEKDVDRMFKEGFTATCNSGGAGSWPTDVTVNSHFFGARVVIIPDNDRVVEGKIPPGEKHALDVKSKLEPFASTVEIVRITPQYKDVSEFFDAGGKLWLNHEWRTN